MKEGKISVDKAESAKAYWKESIRLILGCLVVWFVVSYGFGILLHDTLNSVQIAGFGLGFWFAQQGSIYAFIVLIFFYVHRMNKIDRDHGVQED